MVSVDPVVSDRQMWAVMDDVRGGGPVLAEVLVALVAMRIRTPETFADLDSTARSADLFPDLGDRPVDAKQMFRLIDHVGRWQLPDPGDRAACGRLALRLIDHAAGLRGRMGDHHTPTCLVDLMAGLTGPRAGERIHYAFSRAGELLLGAAIQLPDDALATFSAETASENARWSTHAALRLAGIDGHIGTGPVLAAGDSTYDVVLANPPFGLVLHDIDQHDRRWRYGPPPRHSANFAWLQHALGLLADGGRAAVLMANNAGTSDNPSERAIREAMLRAGVIDTVIALPDRLFPSTPIAPSLWLLRPSRPDPVPDVLLVDATSLGRVQRGRRVLSGDEIAAIGTACGTTDRSRPGPIAGFTAVISVADLADSGSGLNPRAFVGPAASRARVADGSAQLDRALGERGDLLLQLRARQEATDQHLSMLVEIRSAMADVPMFRTTLGAVSALKTGPGKLDDEPGATSSVVVVPRGIRHNRIADAGVTAAPGHAPATNYRLKEGDIVCVRVGQLGRQGLVGAHQAGWLLGPGCLRIRPGAEVDPRYLTYYLGTPPVLDWLDRHATGSAIRGVSARVLGEMALALPPLDVQWRIGTLLSALDDEAEVLEGAATQVVAVRSDAAAILVPDLSEPRE